MSKKKAFYQFMGLCLATFFFIRPLLAFAQESTTTRHLERLPPKVSNQRAQSDLLSVLKPRGSFDSGMLRQLRGIGFETKAYGTEYVGICRHDSLSLRYASTEHDLPPEDSSIKPYSIESSAWYHFLSTPRFSEKRTSPEEYIWDSECEALDSKSDTTWFHAESAFQALQGALILSSAVEQLKLGALKSSSCPSIGNIDNITCEEKIVSVFNIDKITAINQCTSSDGYVCYIIEINGDTEITVKAKGNIKELYFGQITSVSIEEFIVVT